MRQPDEIEMLDGVVIETYRVSEHPSGHEPASLDDEHCAMCNRRLAIFAPYGICAKCEQELNRPAAFDRYGRDG